MRHLIPLLFVVAIASLTNAARADEGQWTPDQIAQLDGELLRSMGLELSPQELWDAAGDERTGGLLRAVVNYGGCTAAFISPDGLMVTNHHCAYGAIQANSTPENDYLKHGFLARERSRELQSKGRTVLVLRKVTDVTDKLRGPAEAESSDQARARLIERLEKQLVRDCEAADPGALRCDVASFYNGSQYRMFEYLDLRDVRIVYAPPASIGEYGGEVDNWMWPRHTGDFTVLRAYVDAKGRPADHAAANVPYRPGRYLEVSTDGVSDGDFVAIVGYPGKTRRYLTSAEIQRFVDQVLPHKVDFYGEWIDILQAHGARDPAVGIKVAALQKRLANRHKNARGMIEGIAHMKLLSRRQREEVELREWAKDKPEYLKVLDELLPMSETERTRHVRSQMLRDMLLGPNVLAIGIELVRKVRAAAKPDIERPSQYQEREWKRLWNKQKQRVRDHDLDVDAALLSSLLTRNLAQPDQPAQRIEPLSELARSLGGKLAGGTAKPPGRDAFTAPAKAMLAKSKLADLTVLEGLWNQADVAALAKSKDPALVLANAIVDIIEVEEERELEHEGALARLLPRYYEMLGKVRSGPVYPDANGTLRLSYASIQGYDKWDGQAQKPQTVLAEAVAKHTGEEPFDLPKAVREQAEAARTSRWADRDLGDLAVCFLSNGDTTGGNSGSPTIDGKGRLIGLNFDRVWENIAGDFSYYKGHSRNVSVDVRYLMWLLEEVAGADHLLREIGIPQAGQAIGPNNREPGAATSQAPAAKTASKSGCGCASSGRPTGSVLLFLVGGLWLLRRRRVEP